MKPKMLLFGGFGWAASSPLIYTLQRNAKYAHFGYTKHFRILYPEGVEGKVKEQPEKRISYIYEKVCDGTWENYKSDEQFSHRMNLSIDLEPLKDFPRKHFTDLITGSPTISKYLDYYHSLHDHVVSKGYKSVGDGFMGVKYNKSIFKEYFKIIKSEFDVKFLYITRDPVRRLFSQYLATMQGGIDKKLEKPLPLRIKPINYVIDIKKVNEIFDEENVHVIVMEELWEDDGTAKKELSEFLDHPITELWKNLYAPDRGHLVEFDKDVPCQEFGQDLLELTPDTYNSLKKKYQEIYDDWENYYGSLPLYWGQPITYS